MSKVEGPIILRLDGGRGPAIPICAPTALLGIGGEPHPNMSKVEGPIILRPDGGRGPATPIRALTALLGTGGDLILI